jgi:hypothetical protein
VRCGVVEWPFVCVNIRKESEMDRRVSASHYVQCTGVYSDSKCLKVQRDIWQRPALPLPCEG